MSTNKIYKIVSKDKLGYSVYKFDKIESLTLFLSMYNLSITSYNTNKRQRKELQECPKFGIAGPMYDGEENGSAVIRYEDESGILDRVNSDRIYQSCLDCANDDLKETKEEGTMFIGQSRVGLISIEYIKESEDPQGEYLINKKEHSTASALNFLSYVYILDFS